MKIPFTNIHLTPREQIGAAATAFTVVAGGWAGFVLGFGSAPLSLVTGLGVPAATAAITATVVGAGVVAKKIGILIADQVEDYAAKNPGGYVDRFLAGEFEITPAQLEEGEDNDLSDDEEVEAENVADLYKDFSVKKALSFTARTLTRPLARQEREVEYTMAPLNRRQIDAIPEGTTRSGKKFN